MPHPKLGFRDVTDEDDIKAVVLTLGWNLWRLFLVIAILVLVDVGCFVSWVMSGVGHVLVVAGLRMIRGSIRVASWAGDREATL